MASSSSASAPPRRVPISIISGRAYVWSPSDVLYLRTTHRIIGILTGSLPLLPQQNAYLGLPLQLMPEEVALLLQRDAALLVDDESAHSAPSTAQWEEWERERESDVRRQRVEAYRGAMEHKRRFEEALRASGRAAPGKAKGKGKGQGKGSAATPSESEAQKAKAAAIAEKRRARQEEKRRQLAAEEEEGRILPEGEDDAAPLAGRDAKSPLDTDDSDSDGDGDGDDGDDANTGIEEPTEEALANYTYTHITHDASTPLPWYRAPSSPSSPPSRALASQFLPAAAAASSSPATPTPTASVSAKQRIFTHLNTQGYFLSCGLRFGGDFVAYPGDPFRYHSHYTVTVPPHDEAPIPAAKLIADGRLGTAVKKVHVVGTVGARRGEREGREVKGEEEEGDGELSFYSLTWAGFGT